ncbi:MAG: hypothetical protein A2066_07100 [Bacteroidetes bacterium GWB2_41_8]|nr:MAG: hypothetical protein A2066_07100 [Bacteroidetes bacterium GWB2_41_8]
MNKIDLHTHQLKSDSSVQILNTFAQDLPVPESEFYYSAGLHPWHINQVNPEECLNSIELSMRQKNILAVGECGLDRIVNTDFAMQQHYFKMQTAIAEKHSKPVIIHCVRAYPELIKLKNETKSSVPWIIHGFQGNQQTAQQLIRNNFYFSVGESLLLNRQKSHILALLPTDRLFLETDDRETSINEIYTLAAQILETDNEILSGIILENFERIFGSTMQLTII